MQRADCQLLLPMSTLRSRLTPWIMQKIMISDLVWITDPETWGKCRLYSLSPYVNDLILTQCVGWLRKCPFQQQWIFRPKTPCKKSTADTNAVVNPLISTHALDREKTMNLVLVQITALGNWGYCHLQWDPLMTTMSSDRSCWMIAEMPNSTLMGISSLWYLGKCRQQLLLLISMLRSRLAPSSMHKTMNSALVRTTDPETWGKRR